MKEVSQSGEKFTKYEKARMIGSRALQISMGAPMKVKLTEEELAKINYSPIAIAKREFEDGTIPIKVIRELPIRKTQSLQEAKAKHEAELVE